MVELDVVQACNKTLVNKQNVTAAIVGGASGIGENAVLSLASTQGNPEACGRMSPGRIHIRA
ncbi:hypothetical protein V1508DRAFT_442376 [Lipomyces doorenjongii]|uniref:uncharacterized protein n=1 Tax=Lipomyces doorenjongii TaxID=383834 RepID=UPI0034CEE941